MFVIIWSLIIDILRNATIHGKKYSNKIFVCNIHNRLFVDELISLKYQFELKKILEYNLNMTYSFAI